jgi:hypothetical protein
MYHLRLADAAAPANAASPVNSSASCDRLRWPSSQLSSGSTPRGYRLHLDEEEVLGSGRVQPWRNERKSMPSAWALLVVCERDLEILLEARRGGTVVPRRHLPRVVHWRSLPLAVVPSSFSLWRWCWWCWWCRGSSAGACIGSCS